MSRVSLALPLSSLVFAGIAGAVLACLLKAGAGAQSAALFLAALCVWILLYAGLSVFFTAQFAHGLDAYLSRAQYGAAMKFVRRRTLYAGLSLGLLLLVLLYVGSDLVCGLLGKELAVLPLHWIALTALPLALLASLRGSALGLGKNGLFFLSVLVEFLGALLFGTLFSVIRGAQAAKAVLIYEDEVYRAVFRAQGAAAGIFAATLLAAGLLFVPLRTEFARLKKLARRRRGRNARRKKAERKMVDGGV